MPCRCLPLSNITGQLYNTGESARRIATLLAQKEMSSGTVNKETVQDYNIIFDKVHFCL